MSKKNEVEKIIFSISNSEDLTKLESFKKAHIKSCKDKYPDAMGALFKYTFIPTGLGDLCIVKCSCGEQITLSKDLE